MSEETPYFFNSLPNLLKVLKGTPKEKEMLNSIEEFLKQSFISDLHEKAKRFLEVPSIGFIPANKEYFKLYYELIQLYTGGMYYSSIVLSGVLCERICYDILLKKRINVEDRPLSEEQTVCLFEMNLAYLFELLHDWGLIKEDTKGEMWEINRKRNEYVHPKKSQPSPQKDALQMIKRITKILVNEFEVKMEPKGTVTFP
jgi:hypothetical protein